MREFGTHEGSDILTRAYDTLAEGPLEVRQPCHPDDDVMVKWQRLRERSARRPLDRTTATAQSDAAFNDRVAACIRAAFSKGAFMNDVLGDQFGYALAEERRRMRAHVKAELEGLRREITQLRNHIKALEQQRRVEQSIIAWTIDRKGFRAVPWLANGKPAVPIPLRGLFEEYQRQTE
jgi:hypothetical protein